MANSFHYTAERNIQIVIALLKANNIHRIVVSPGATNVTFVGSIQYDPFFELISCVDERSAAYMACGIAAETGEPVVINCTGATSSRDWMPGLTEAFYRKLPILAISSSQETCKVGHLIAQVTNRSTPPVDCVLRSFEVGLVKSASDEFDATIKTNSAISLLTRNGGGPVHINLITGYSSDFSCKEISAVRKITRYTTSSVLPELPTGRIAISIGSHKRFDQRLTKSIEAFCEKHDAVVFCDYTSGYNGKYAVNLSISISQKKSRTSLHRMDLLIHLGEVSGDYNNVYRLEPNRVWRVNSDGELRDLYQRLECVFDMEPYQFFEHYSDLNMKSGDYLAKCQREYEDYYAQIPELPFSNLWIAKQMHDKLPTGSCVHFGILNSLRSWSFFRIADTITSDCNVGGFGIDGVLSTAIGASICGPEKLFFCILGDLSFFYDMNVMGNRQIGNNIRVLVINNGRGQEFKNSNHPGNRFGEDTDKYIAASGHNGYMSRNVIRHFAIDLGFEYLSAENKEQFMSCYESFLSATPKDKPMVFEVFTDTADETRALDIMYNIFDVKDSAKEVAKAVIKDAVESTIGRNRINAMKTIIKG